MSLWINAFAEFLLHDTVDHILHFEIVFCLVSLTLHFLAALLTPLATLLSLLLWSLSHLMNTDTTDAHMPVLGLLCFILHTVSLFVLMTLIVLTALYILRPYFQDSSFSSEIFQKSVSPRPSEWLYWKTLSNLESEYSQILNSQLTSPLLTKTLSTCSSFHRMVGRMSPPYQLSLVHQSVSSEDICQIHLIFSISIDNDL